MSLGKRAAQQPAQAEFWVATAELPQSSGHPFYQKLDELLAADSFDDWLEAECAPYYHSTSGRPSIPPGVYFRMLLIGYFEGLSAQRAIVWRCSDSLSLRAFLGLALTQATPDHSSLTRISERLPRELTDKVFQRVLAMAHRQQLLSGKTVGIDSTTLEANAAMKSIVRRDNGQDWPAYVTELMREAGVIAPSEQPSREEIARFDRKRTDKSVSNDDWVSESDGDARITQMKDGTTHLAYKAEHVVDLESEFILAAEVHHADVADTKTLSDTVLDAQVNLQAAEIEIEIEEVVADKGYHSRRSLEEADAVGLRTYIPEKKLRGESRLDEEPEAVQRAVRLNHERMQRDKGKQLQRQRSEKVERSFAHVCETGGARRCWLRGLKKVQQRYLFQAIAHNLGVLMRKLFGVGTPRSLPGAKGFAALLSFAWLTMIESAMRWSARWTIYFYRLTFWSTERC